MNQLRTHQGQSDVFVINENGAILAPTFGGGANSLVTEVLGDAAIISSDLGGNPPYEKMKAAASICYRHFLNQTNVLFIIGGKSNNTDIYETFRGMGDALREYFVTHGPTPLYVVVGRGGPNLVRGMGNLAETLDSLGGESRQVTPASHAFSGGNVVFGTSPGRAGQALGTALGDIPVFNNVREGLDAGHGAGQWG